MSNYLRLLSELNKLGGTDIAFFIICAVLIVVAVGVYFLIPVINKKQYQEQRDNLRKREEAFKVNKKQNNSEEAEPVQQDSPDTSVSDK